MPTHEQIEQRAYQLWEERGCPYGEPAVDWERAERELREQGRDNEPSRPRPVSGPLK
jgi:hypothetical protein